MGLVAFPAKKDNGRLDAETSDSLLFIQRPEIRSYDWHVENDSLGMIPAGLLDEAAALRLVSQQKWHRNIVKFYGCRVRRGRITGLVLEKFDDTLKEFVEAGNAVPKTHLMKTLYSAVQHIHSHDLAHNDIHPGTIMINIRTKEPVLVGFGYCRRIGDMLIASPREKAVGGWREEGMTTSDPRRVMTFQPSSRFANGCIVLALLAPNLKDTSCEGQVRLK